MRFRESHIVASFRVNNLFNAASFSYGLYMEIATLPLVWHGERIQIHPNKISEPVILMLSKDRA